MLPNQTSHKIFHNWVIRTAQSDLYIWVFVFVWGGQWEERENLKQVPHPARSQRRAQTHDPEIMTWAETKGQKLTQLSPPGAPDL